MAKIRCGLMYMVRLDHPSNVYGWAVTRVWWMPWRYNLHLHYMGHRGDNGYLADVHEDVYRNLTLDGVKGMLKLFELWKED
jgi:alpha-tubulin suppressor-like RCC1 family protein